MTIRGFLPTVVLFLLLALLSFAIAVLRRRSRLGGAAARRDARLVEPDLVTPPRDPALRTRPWWGSPWLWGAVSVAFAALGVFVWPWLFGGVFLFVPFVWVSRPRSDGMDPRSNGHARRSTSGL